MTEPLVLTTPLGGAPLARAAMAGRAPEWYRARPHDAGAWRTYVAALRDEYRAKPWLEALLPAIAPSGAARARLERSAGGRGIVVTTGQQPGLFGGPLYTWNKALSALALANEIERLTAVPTAPVFWAATDDADFAEASVTYVAVPGGLETLTMPGPALEGRSMRDTPLGDVTDLWRTLERGSGAAVHRDALEITRNAYPPGATVGGAYVTLLRALLQPLGISVLDAGHPATRVAMRPLLKVALERCGSVEQQLAARERALRDAGFEPQVQSIAGLSLVFETRDEVRERIPIASSRAVAASANADLGPNVLLRPIIERALLPTAAYVAGPGEIAYFAQVGAVAESLDRAPPLVLPRWSGMIIEPHVARILDRYALPPAALQDPHAAERDLVRKRLPDGVMDYSLQRFREQVDAAAAELAWALRSAQDVVLPEAVLEGMRRSTGARVARLERRILAAAKRANATLMRDVATARAALYPLGAPQERKLNFIPLLARHGPVLLRSMLGAATAHASSMLDGGAGSGAGDDAATLATTALVAAEASQTGSESKRLRDG